MIGFLSRLSARTGARGIRLSMPRSPWTICPRTAISQPVRTIVYTETGAVLERPEQVRFGMIKALLVVVPFTCLGAMMSKSGAAVLEENDIFVPQEDDD